MSTQFSFSPFNANVNWKHFDVIYDGYYQYATQDMPIGGRVSAPSLLAVYSASSYKREDDIVTVYFSQTGNVPNFTVGSIIKTFGLGNTSMNYTGMVIDGGSGWASYINPGWSEGVTATAGTVSGSNPGWTTGFLFVPTYSSRLGTENQAIVTQLGNGYSQRMSNGVNTFQQNYTLVFQNRSSREARAMMNFVEDKGGVNPFPIMIPDSMLSNQPNHKFIAASIDVSPVGYNLNDIQIPVVRVFDP